MGACEVGGVARGTAADPRRVSRKIRGKGEFGCPLVGLTAQVVPVLFPVGDAAPVEDRPAAPKGKNGAAKLSPKRAPATNRTAPDGVLRMAYCPLPIPMLQSAHVRD
jgi:hypothetical protein